MATYYEQLTSVGLPISFADETGKVVLSIELTQAQAEQFSDITLQYFQPVKWNDILLDRADKQQITN